ncbi:MAG: hypothetical protein FWG87_13110 [Defluviitaleaceae bacterium]|nr:hypothetical protein [Defluviitaleaceae bacterium]
MVIVGGGFIRPEVCTFVNLGRATSINAERGNLGTDKSVPYKRYVGFVVRAAVVAARGFSGFTQISPRANPRNP